MSKVRSGQRRCFIEIQVPVNTKQSNGSVVTVWNKFAEMWASIETLKGGERASSAAIWPSADQKITFRYIFGILPTMRVKYNNIIYSILNVNNVDMRNREIVLTTNSGISSI